MKILFEVLLNAQDLQKSQFMWLSNKNNWLFIIEDGKRMRTLGVDSDPGKELQSTTLTETKACTSLSWNKDGTLLALVVDKRQIYFWEIKTNNFTHFKPINKITNLAHASMGKQNKAKEVELIEWSKVSNKLVICYSTGQLLLCDCDCNLSERFIDNSDGVLKRILSIESSKYADMFVCITIISELLVMTFNGESKFYVQCDDFTIVKAELSPITESQILDNKRQDGTAQRLSPELKFDRNLWLVYQTKDDKLLLKRISLYGYSLSETNSRVDVTYVSPSGTNSHLVDFHWLSSAHLIACFSSGTIELIHMKSANCIDGQSTRVTLSTEKLLNINYEEEFSSGVQSKQIFKSFELMSYNPLLAFDTYSGSKTQLAKKQQADSSFSMAIISAHKLFYYELVEVDNHRYRYAFEKVDDLNLTGSLNKLKLELERVKWCFDCSMLAVQLNNGHILVYRTRIQDYMVALHGSRTAYISGANEITILNYGSQMSPNNQCEVSDGQEKGKFHKQEVLEEVPEKKEEGESTEASTATTNNDNALVINVDLSPSIIAVGPKHLAVAMNNRILFYLVGLSKAALGDKPDDSGGFLVDEEEYVSIVVAISLSSRFVAVQFDDGRLKLHAIQSRKLTTNDVELRPTSNNPIAKCAGEVLLQTDLYDSDERFFPDPTEPEKITTFVLTEELLLYCTQQCNLNVFSLGDWSIVQTCDHSKHFLGPILKLRANERANKFICLLATNMATTDDDNVFMYDLYSNQMIRFVENDLYSRIFASQLILNLPGLEAQHKLNEFITSTTTTTTPITRSPNPVSARPKLGRVIDAIWDGDGKTVLLIEQKRIHIFVTLDHTLEREDSLIWYVSTTNKASSYTILYASQGIVSFQTALGRVINSILESHDDELRLVRLEQQIARMREHVMSPRDKEEVGEEEEAGHGGQTEEAAIGSTRQQLHQQQQVENGNSKSPPLESLLWAQEEVMNLKLDYLKTILPIYSLSKCKEICEHLMSEDVFQLMPGDERFIKFDQVIWAQLAAWALFTMNLNFALLIYRKHGPLLCAHVLNEIIRDAHNKRLDGKGSVRTRLLVLLGRDI